MSVRVIDHPLSRHLLGILRDESTDQAAYRDASNRITHLLVLEAFRDLPTQPVSIKTPMETCEVQRIECPVIVIPILRAGLGMLSTFLELFPAASVGYIGLERDEDTAIASEYYCKLPVLKGGRVFIVDPMLATGGSACKALEVLFSKNSDVHCTLLSILSAPEGLAKVEKAFPSVEIVTAAIDRELDENQFIRPGLGDFGDRLFGT